LCFYRSNLNGLIETNRLENYASWIASAATMIAAMMTAVNLGARLTGWGFVVFTIGSVAWIIVGFFSGQTSLIITNGFLFAVNLFGVWRWLGRQAAYEQGSAVAIERSSAQQNVPTLFSSAGLIGTTVEGLDGQVVGTVIDSMLACDTKQLRYIVIAQGGVMGAGEVLRALSPSHFETDENCVRCNLTSAQIASLPVLKSNAWPTIAPKLSAIANPIKGENNAKFQDRAVIQG
jgi:PRC-barrel domain